MSAVYTGAGGVFLNFFTSWATTQAFTLFGRFKRTGTKVNGSLMGFGKSAATFIVADDSTGGTQGTQLYFNGGPNPTGLTPQIQANAWSWVAMTWNGSGASTPTPVVWVDGTVVYNTAGGLVESSTDLFFGSCGYSALIGKIGYSYAWSAVLTDPQILAQGSQQLPITNTNLYASWPLVSDGLDISGNLRDLGNTGVTFDAADNPTFGSTPRAVGFFGAVG